MDEQEKKLAIRVGVGVVILVALYYLMSPYHNCLRDKADSMSDYACTIETSW